MLKVLLTGGAGFLGSALVKRLDGNADLVVVDSLDPQVHPDSEFPRTLQDSARCIRADLRNPLEYASALEGVDAVVHLAAQTGTAQSMYELERYTSSNVSGTASLLDALCRCEGRLPKVVLASSRAVYGEGSYQSPNGPRPAHRHADDLGRGIWDTLDETGTPVALLPMRYGHPTEPVSIYGLTKLWQEQLLSTVCASRDIDYSILRFQNVFGPGQAIGNPYTGIIGYLTARILADEEVEVFEDGLMTRDFLFIDDAALALETVIKYAPRPGKTFDIGSEIQSTMLEVVEAIGRATRKRPRVNISGRFRTGDVRHALADRSAYDAMFGSLKCTPLEDGLQEYCSWFRTQRPTGVAPHLQALQELEVRGLFREVKPLPARS